MTRYSTLRRPRSGIGYEAAYLLSRIVTPATAQAWIERAEQRTVKHLREEVEAAEVLVRMGLGREQAPLDEGCLEPLFELERRVVSGELFEVETACANDTRGQMSGGVRRLRHVGRVRWRWVVREETARFYRALERVFVRVAVRICRVPMSFLRFLCESFCQTWVPALRRARLTESGEPPAYYGVYRRDRFRCASPVCSRRDVTPHHLRFRSHGGGDEDENVTTLCVWCHLFGVHGGRIVAKPPASRVRWRIGRRGTVFVEGRRRVAEGPSVDDSATHVMGRLRPTPRRDLRAFGGRSAVRVAQQSR